MMLYLIEREINFAPFACVRVYTNPDAYSTSQEYISSLQERLKLGYWLQPYCGRYAKNECSTVIFYGHLRHVSALTKIENDLTWSYEYYPQLKMPKPHNQNIIIDSEQLWKNLQK